MLGLLEGLVGDGRPEVGAGDGHRHVPVVRGEGEVDGLGVDREPVAAEPDGLPSGTALVEVGAVLEGTPRLLPGSQDLAVQLLGAHGLAQFAHLLGGAAQPRHHRVRGEVGVDVLERGQGRDPPVHALQHAGGGGDQPVGPAGPLVHQRLLAGGERLVDVLALVRQLFEEVVELGEARLQVLQLEHDPAQLLVAVVRGVGGRDGPGDGLPQQGELGGELGPALPGEQFLALRLQRGAGPVDPGHHLADPLQDAGAHLGVADVEGPDHLGDHLQALGLFGDPLADRGGGADRLQCLGLLDQPFHLGVVAVEGVFLLQEGHGAAPGRGDLLAEALLHRVDPVGVHVAHLAQRGGLALGAAQVGQAGHPPLRRARGLAP